MYVVQVYLGVASHPTKRTHLELKRRGLLAVHGTYCRYTHPLFTQAYNAVYNMDGLELFNVHLPSICCSADQILQVGEIVNCCMKLGKPYIISCSQATQYVGW